MRCSGWKAAISPFYAKLLLIGCFGKTAILAFEHLRFVGSSDDIVNDHRITVFAYGNARAAKAFRVVPLTVAILADVEVLMFIIPPCDDSGAGCIHRDDGFRTHRSIDMAEKFTFMLRVLPLGLPRLHLTPRGRHVLYRAFLADACTDQSDKQEDEQNQWDLSFSFFRFSLTFSLEEAGSWINKAIHTVNF